MPERRTDGSIEVVAYRPEWVALFERERAVLSTAFGARALSIEHIGSTSVPGMASKPTIDVLVVVPAIDDVVPSCVGALEEIGYDYRGPFFGEEGSHVVFRKIVGGKRIVHLHVSSSDSPEPARYRLFRSFLIAVPEAAARYEACKWSLLDSCGGDRDVYVGEKQRFVDGLMAEADSWQSAAGRSAEAT